MYTYTFVTIAGTANRAWKWRMPEDNKTKCQIIYWGEFYTCIDTHTEHSMNLMLCQWVACGVGVISSSALVFSLIAMWKQNEKFDKEVMTPIRNYLRR